MLTYGGVAKTLGFTEHGPQSTQAEALKKGLRVLDELARKLRRRRMQRGALDLDLPEARVVLDPKTGAPVDVIRRAQDPGVKRAYSMIEELMLLANETVARFLLQKKSPAVYRVHGKPDEQKLERLGLVARKLGVEIDLETLSDPLGVSRWLTKIQKHPRKNVLEMLLLRSLKQAVYDTNNVGHFGLASEAYVHFTSPIRRYPDVEVHRAVKHLLRGGKPDTSPAALEALGVAATRASTRERAAMDVEREVVDLYRTLLMRDRLGETHEGTVTALVGSGVYVSLDAPFVDVLVRFEGLGPDRYEASEDEISVVGARSGDTVSLGDRMLVTIEDVAVLRRTVYARRVVPEAALKHFDDARPEPGGKEHGRVRRERRQIQVGERRGPGRTQAGRGGRDTRTSRFGQRAEPNRGTRKKGRKGRR
jgi:ribonuclease R